MNQTLPQARIMHRLFVLFFLMAGVFATTQVYAENSTNRYITGKTHLFEDMSGNYQTVVDENSNTVLVPGGIIGEIEKGQAVTEIHRIRFSRMQVSLADGRKGWVEIQLVSPSGEKDAYLLRKLKLSELLTHPNSGNSAVPVSDENKNVKFKRKTPLRVIEWKHVAENNNNRLNQSGKWWAKVEIEGNTGWIEKSRFRFQGQMFDSAIPFIWYPVHWFNNLLGDGFWAGFFIFFLLVIPMTIGYVIARYISSWLRFLPNFVLYLIIITTGLVIYSKTFMSIWDASVFNVAGGLTMGLLGLLMFIAGISSFVVLRKRIFVTRCPDCKHWEGKVLESKLLSDTTTTYTTKWTYSDGTSKKEVSHVQIQSWQDFCNCEHCGYCWKINRVETNEY